jgi:hypothetical protein
MGTDHFIASDYRIFTDEYVMSWFWEDNLEVLQETFSFASLPKTLTDPPVVTLTGVDELLPLTTFLSGRVKVLPLFAEWLEEMGLTYYDVHRKRWARPTPQ